MKKILLFLMTICAFANFNTAKAQCDLAINNLVITPASAPNPLPGGKCEYFFNASFDITTNSGFKYLFFHSWLAEDYPDGVAPGNTGTPIFDCSGNQPSVDPGTNLQLGTAVDQAGKSFMDIGFVGLKEFLATNPATSP